MIACPNVERCGGELGFQSRVEDAGEPPHSAWTTVVECTEKTCACDLSPEQWADLETEAIQEYSDDVNAGEEWE